MRRSVLWDDLNARARGLSTRLLGGVGIAALAQEPDTGALARRLRETAWGEALPVGAAPGELDLAVRRAAARWLALLVRRAAGRRDAFEVFTREEDRRSVRALLRGAAAGASVDARLAGLLPTPALPERALEALARLPEPGPVAATLAAWRDPYGAAVLEEASRAQPDLDRIERRLSATYARLIARAARRGGAALRAYAAESIDAENIRAAVALAGRGAPAPADAFLPGGRVLGLDAFLAAVAAPDGERALAALAAELGPRHPLGRALALTQPARLEESLLRVRLRRWRSRARRRPIGPAPLLAYLLALRAEVVDLRTIVWGVAMHMPAGPLRERLVSVP